MRRADGVRDSGSAVDTDEKEPVGEVIDVDDLHVASGGRRDECRARPREARHPIPEPVRGIAGPDDEPRSGDEQPIPDGIHRRPLGGDLRIRILRKVARVHEVSRFIGIRLVVSRIDGNARDEGPVGGVV